MMLFTTDAPPAGWRVVEYSGFVSSRYPVQISQKGALQAIFEKNRNEDQEVIDHFVKSVRNYECSSGKMANAVVGLRMETSAAPFSDKTQLIVTMYGTVVRVEMDS